MDKFHLIWETTLTLGQCAQDDCGWPDNVNDCPIPPKRNVWLRSDESRVTDEA